jgi:hypothetical protein
MSHYAEYYQKQALSGQAPNSSARGMRGYGFRSFVSGLLPFVKKAGRTLYKQGVGIGSDIIEGENVLETLKKRGISAAEEIADEACQELQKRKAQRGTGVLRRRIRRVIPGSRKVRKTIRRVSRCRTRKCLKRRSKTASASLLKLLSLRQHPLKSSTAKTRRRKK